MPHRTPKNPLHGVTLEAMLTALVERCGWEKMAQEVDIRCFKFEPSIGSSLHFLRRTPWARAKVEKLYLATKPAKAGGEPEKPAAVESRVPVSRFLGPGGQDKAAFRAHAMNRSHAHFKSDNRTKV